MELSHSSQLFFVAKVDLRVDKLFGLKRHLEVGLCDQPVDKQVCHLGKPSEPSDIFLQNEVESNI